MSRSFPLVSQDGPLGRLASHVRTPLFGSAYALMVSSISTSVLGLAYWTLAARLYSTDDVGVNATAISTMTVISYLAQLNLWSVLTRFVPTAGPATSRLVIGAYGLATALSGLVAGVFVLLLARVTSPALTLVATPLGAGWFVLATMAWSLFALQDGVLAGLRRTLWVPVENIVFAIAKIALLLAFLGTVDGNGIFASWTIPAALLLVPVNLAIFRRFIPRHVARTPEAVPEVQFRRILPYLVGDYVGSLLSSTIMGLLPLIVLTVVGASGSAYFYVAWTIAYALMLNSINMATSLTVEGSSQRDRLRGDSQRMLRLLFRLQLPTVLAVVVLAPLILHIFGGNYAAEAETLLRLLAVSVIPHGINALYLSIARVRRQVGRIVLVQAATAGLTLLFSLLLLGRIGITGVGVAWLAAQGMVALVVVTTQLAPLWVRPRPVLDRWPGAPGVAVDEAAPLLGRVLETLDVIAPAWALLRSEVPDLGAGDVDLLVARDAEGRLAPALNKLGFTELPGAGRGSHRFFLARDPASGAWLNLDVVTEIAHGRFFELRAPVAGAVLARRELAPTGARLQPDDAFWALLLHCVLDKRQVSPAHAARLAALVGDARDDGPLGAFALRLLPAGWDGERVRAVVNEGDWAALVGLRPAVASAWRRRDRAGVAWRFLSGALARGLEPLLLLGRRHGLSVTLLGPDGAGKSTLSDGIAADFGLPVKRVYMGMWSKAHSTGVPGLDIVLRPFTAWWRYLVGRVNVAAGKLVIFDRYTYDALIPPTGALIRLKRPYLWVLAHLLPAPGLVLVLDAPGDMLFARKGEFDPARLEADRAHFRALVARIPNVVVLDAARSADAVRSEAIDRIWRRAAGGPEAGGAVPGGIAPPSTLVMRGVVRVSHARRRLTDRRPLARALAELPEILSSLPTDAVGRDRKVAWARRSATGVVVAGVGSCGNRARAVVKMAEEPDASDALMAHAAKLASLRVDPRLQGWVDHAPSVLGFGRSHGITFVVESALPGVPAQPLVRDPAVRRVLLPAAGAVIGELHRRTSTPLELDDAVLEEWVARPLRELAAALAGGAEGSPADRELDWLGERLADGLRRRSLRVGWIHGDYWLGNLLASPDGEHVTGIVDWDQSEPAQLPMHDVVHLLLYTRRLLRRRELGDVICGLLAGEPLDDVERATVEAAGFVWPDRDEVRLDIALAWLRHVGTFIVLPGHGSSSLWMRRNVDAVLRNLVPGARF